MKPGCVDCRRGSCYHILESKVAEVKELRDRIEMLESAVEMLEERLSFLMEEQHIEPYILDLSDDDANKIKDWVFDKPTNLPDRFRDISNGE